MNSKTCIITGGSRGIGKFLSRKFVENGYKVLIGARTLPIIAREFEKSIKFKTTDVRFEADHYALVKTALEWTGRADVYINNAGFSRWCAISKVDEKFFDEMISTNLKGVLWGCKAAASALGAGGSIINISSLAGKRGSANNAVYCASKFGVNGITQSLAKELGPLGIRVNAVCPVYIQTDGVLKALEENVSPAGEESVESYLANFAEANAALKRLPKGEEVAAMCLFLASEGASAITGQCINVDCGVLPQ